MLRSRTGDMKAKKHDQRGKMTDAKIHKVFDDMVKSRKLRRAAHFVTQRVMMILMKNQASQFQKYFIPTTSSSKDTWLLAIVQKMPCTCWPWHQGGNDVKNGRSTQRCCWRRGTDSETIASWLLKFGTYSQDFRNAMARLAKWLSNDKPPWAAVSLHLTKIQEFIPWP